MKPSFYFTWARQSDATAIPVERAEACHYVAPGGARVLDLVSTSFQAGFGLSFSPIIEALRVQLGILPVASPKAVFDLKERASAELIRLLALGPGRIFYTVSGAESVENALKMARQITGRRIVVSREDSYHGATLGALSVTGDWRRAPHATVDEWNIRVPSPLDDPDFSRGSEMIERADPDKIAALVFETVSGVNGVICGGEAWWKGVEEARRKHGLILILDEVLCGFYRTGAPFAFQRRGLRPDFVCLAKAMTGGYFPLGAVWTAKAVADYYEDRVLACGLTNYAHPVGLAAFKAVLDTLADRAFLRRITELEGVFAGEMELFREIAGVRAVRREGLLACADLAKAVPAKAFLEKGLHVATGENRVVFAPAFVMEPEELREGLKTARGVIANA